MDEELWEEGQGRRGGNNWNVNNYIFLKKEIIWRKFSPIQFKVTFGTFPCLIFMSELYSCFLFILYVESSRFDISDERAAGVIHEFHSHLHVLSLQTNPAQHFGYPSQLDGLHMTHVHDGRDMAESGHFLN